VWAYERSFKSYAAIRMGDRNYSFLQATGQCMLDIAIFNDVEH